MRSSENARAFQSWTHVARRGAALGVVALTGLASMATSDVRCPQSVSFSETLQLGSHSTLTRSYRASAEPLISIHVLLKATSTENALVRAHIEAAGDTGDASDGVVELALRPRSESTAEFVLGSCRGECSMREFSLLIEHIEGAPVTLSWDVVLESGSCDEDFHAKIDRL